MVTSVRKTQQGTVVRRSGDKTVVVEVHRFVIHPRVKKYIRRRSRFHVHDAANRAGVGDVVVIQESRPLSRTKRWVLQSIMRKGVVTTLPAGLSAT